ncbi:MAG: methylmalonyl-CoA mutase [Ardenticatenaceae bacterium]|nr:methylmalonyl-CoA mutase [Ardenticatenaceae bacterium]
MSDDPQAAPLFAEFSPPTAEEWLEATIASLKGKPIEKLTHHSYEGIAIEPLLSREATAEFADTTPGQFPYRRGTKATVNAEQPWLIAQQLAGPNPQQLNEQLRHDLAQGQTAVSWVPEFDFTAADVRTIFNGVDLGQIPLFVPYLPGLPLLAQLAAARPDDLAALRGGLLHDPVAWLAGMGSQPLDALYDQTAVLTRWAIDHAPNLHTVAVMPVIYHEAGANAVQEIGLLLATAVHHMRELQQRGLSVDEIGERITAVFSLGSDFFMEIAKLRAARSTWAQMMAAFGGSESAHKLTIHAQTSASSKSPLDPYVNMLRATTEAFAAALGGADSIEIAPFDMPQRPSTDFSRRIARNVHHILQDEVNLARLLDPAGGAYAVEHLTDELAQRGWAYFQEIEAAGGIVAVLQAGTVQAQIATTAAARQKDLATRKTVMVGTNLYANLAETPLPQPEAEPVLLTRKEEKPDPKPALTALANAAPDAQVSLAIAAAQAGATLAQLRETLVGKGENVEVMALRPFHPAAPFATLRRWANQYTEDQGHRPQIFLANMGPLRQHKARADFSRSFFEVGGFELLDSDGFASPAAAAQAALESGAQAVVICSSDDTYPEIVPPLVQSIKSQQPDTAVILAGYPKEQIEAHKAAGIDAFIHLGADCLALNQWLQARLSA